MLASNALQAWRTDTGTETVWSEVVSSRGSRNALDRPLTSSPRFRLRCPKSAPKWSLLLTSFLVAQSLSLYPVVRLLRLFASSVLSEGGLLG